ncbi:MAG TPA: sensor histidine kinase [Balneolaceae bacterium]
MLSTDLESTGLTKYYMMLLGTGLILVSLLVAGWVTVRNRVNKETAKIQKSLGEKEILLREIHHRVKNNLSIISGLIELQLHNTEDMEARRVLKDSQSRIHSMAMIHDKLYQTNSLSQINLNSYIKELVETLHRTFAKQESVALEFEMEEVSVDIDQIIPCGLMINELVVNAFKHAFKNSGGILSIKLKKENGWAKLIVADNGPGMPANIQTEKKDSLGLLLISTFAAQLEAKTEFTGNNGTRFKIRFPLN